MMDLFPKLEGELLSQKVYRILKDAIVEQKLEPGMKLSETEIANQIGVSRTPVREALRELAVKGLAISTPNQGMVVSTIDIQDVKEVLQIRRVLEGLAASLVTEIITDEEIQRLEEIISEMEHFVRTEEVLYFSKMADQFHELMFKVSGNKRLLMVRNEIHDIELRFGIKSLNVPGRTKKSLAEHLKILEAIKKRDSDEADFFSKQHVTNVIENLLKTVED